FRVGIAYVEGSWPVAVAVPAGSGRTAPGFAPGSGPVCLQGLAPDGTEVACGRNDFRGAAIADSLRPDRRFDFSLPAIRATLARSGSGPACLQGLAPDGTTSALARHVRRSPALFVNKG